MHFRLSHGISFVDLARLLCFFHGRLLSGFKQRFEDQIRLAFERIDEDDLNDGQAFLEALSQDRYEILDYMFSTRPKILSSRELRPFTTGR